MSDKRVSIHFEMIFEKDGNLVEIKRCENCNVPVSLSSMFAVDCPTCHTYFNTHMTFHTNFNGHYFSGSQFVQSLSNPVSAEQEIGRNIGNSGDTSLVERIDEFNISSGTNDSVTTMEAQVEVKAEQETEEESGVVVAQNLKLQQENDAMQAKLNKPSVPATVTKANMNVNKMSNKKFRCDYCDCSYAAKQNLQRHLSTKHPAIVEAREANNNAKSRFFVCNDCGQPFLSKLNFLKHQAGHNRSKTYVCKKCNIGFWEKLLLADHLQKHEVKIAKPYRCDICYGLFTENRRLRAHMFTIHGIVQTSPALVNRKLSGKAVLLKKKIRSRACKRPVNDTLSSASSSRITRSAK